MSFKAVLIVALIFTTTISKSASDKPKCHTKQPKCPDGLPKEPLTAKDVAKTTSETTSKLWSSDIKLSCEAEQLRDQLLTMSNSTNEDWQGFSSVASLRIWSVLPQIKTTKPNLCPFAQLVNATPSWSESGCCEELAPAIRKIAKEIQHRAMVGFDSGLANTGCGKMIVDENGKMRIVPLCYETNSTSPTSKLALKDTCYANGLVYDIEGILDYMGDTYSDVPGADQDIKCILRSLYYSDDYQDNVIALITAAASTPPLQSIVSDFSDDLKFTFYRLSFLRDIPQCCCGKYRHDLMQIYKQIPVNFQNTLEDVLKTYCRRSCCH